jgi:hypothetical protein
MEFAALVKHLALPKWSQWIEESQRMRQNDNTGGLPDSPLRRRCASSERPELQEPSSLKQCRQIHLKSVEKAKFAMRHSERMNCVDGHDQVKIKDH